MTSGVTSSKPTVTVLVFQASPHTGAPQPTALPQMFNVMSLNDPSQDGWVMDTGATSHIHSNACIFCSISNKSYNLPSVLVGNGTKIPVSKTGHTFLSNPNPYCPLVLKNVLITPEIIKNLISVRKFTRANLCSIEFDAYGFSVKDFQTKQTLLRCDSTGDLYPVTPHIPQAFVFVDSTIWHQRIGHPGPDVFNNLFSQKLIPCKYNKSSSLCHSCQLGKHTRLPFQLSTSVTSVAFEIVHSDVWTSPILSNSSFNYYVLFLDQYSHHVCVYPLKTKS